MDNQQYGKLFSFIWNIANDVLVFAFEKGDYKKIILPFTVLRRIDVLLEETKAKVLEKKKFCDKNKLPYEQFLPPVTGYPFYNASAFTMATLKNEIDPQRLKMNVLEYFNGFSPDVQDVIDKFQLRHWVDALTNKGRLGSILEKFTDTSINLSIKPIKDDDGKVILPGLDNHTMGTMFEELLRRFNEENNVTEAGEHFTPRDYVRLLARLAVEPIKDSLKDGTYTIYDGASGTGGILTVTQEEFDKVAAETGKKIKTLIFGQELQDDTYATCKADLMISGNIKKFTYRLGSSDHQYIACGSTISQDGHAGERFDFCVMNPPFGTPWKEDLKNWGIGDKKEVSDPRFFDGETSFIPDIGDCQMLFLANSVSRMRNTERGTRIVEVHDKSSICGGDAADGASNLRKYIIENDMLEAIVAMPEKEFYNTEIGTYIWIVTNRKEPRRRGKVQLIDARRIFTSLQNSLGKKSCAVSDDDAGKIVKLLIDFKNTPESKIFPNEEFGFWQVPVMRPKRNADGGLVLKKGKPVMAKARNEFEQIPFSYPGGIEAYFQKEVKPYDAEAEFGAPEVGYKMTFEKYFSEAGTFRTVDDILSDIWNVNDELKQLYANAVLPVLRGVDAGVQMKDSGIPWVGNIPAHWSVEKVRKYAKEGRNKNKGNVEKNILSLSYGKIVRKRDTAVGLKPSDYSTYQIVEKDYVILRLTDLQNDHKSLRCGIAKERGIITSAYVSLIPEGINPAYLYLALNCYDLLKVFYSMGDGLRQTMNYADVAGLYIPVPPTDEQEKIVAYANQRSDSIDGLVAKLIALAGLLKEYKQKVVADLAIGQIKVP